MITDAEVDAAHEAMCRILGDWRAPSRNTVVFALEAAAATRPAPQARVRVWDEEQGAHFIRDVPAPQAGEVAERLGRYADGVDDQGHTIARRTMVAAMRQAADLLTVQAAEIERLKGVAHGFVDEIATKDKEIAQLRHDLDSIESHLDRIIADLG